MISPAPLACASRRGIPIAARRFLSVETVRRRPYRIRSKTASLSVVPSKLSPPSTLQSISLFQEADDLNAPDPTRYCQNFDVRTSVRILESWIERLNIDKQQPAFQESRNLACLVPNNPCLQKLVQLGADLSKMESVPGVANMLVKADFDKMIAPKLWILSDRGFDLSQVARVISVFPKIFKLPDEELISRISHFTTRGFTPEQVVSFLTIHPQILSLESVEVDRKLRDIINVFHFNDSDIHAVVVGASACIVQPLLNTKDVFVVMTKMLGFSLPVTREMIVECPRIIITSRRVLCENFYHLNSRLNLPLDVIAKSPKALTSSPRILAERTNFLVHCKLFQPDGSKYVSVLAFPLPLPSFCYSVLAQCFVSRWRDHNYLLTVLPYRDCCLRSRRIFVHRHRCFAVKSKVSESNLRFMNPTSHTTLLVANTVYATLKY
ncbi:unnamed protein product [Dibothriocephalus latus]|uniref:Uncharacterized protein n=1 Tax=Dibothriocephalus latus TaxID=60516 RepID=A0A3P7M195_DIBLA|nr:unnamed protein product [Dibothriocephalus latus]